MVVSNRKWVFQPSIFRGYVSFREGIWIDRFEIVGGWTNPSEISIGQNGNLSPIFGVNIKKYVKPPPSLWLILQGGIPTSCK